MGCWVLRTVWCHKTGPWIKKCLRNPALHKIILLSLALTVSLSILFSASSLHPYSFLYYTFPFPLSFSTFHQFKFGHFAFFSSSITVLFSLGPLSPHCLVFPKRHLFQLSVLLPWKHYTKHFFPISYKAYICSSVHVTCLSVRSMSMPWFQGAAGLARQSPALPLREMSTFCLRRFRKASAITITPSYVRAEVYCRNRGSLKGQHIQ